MIGARSRTSVVASALALAGVLSAARADAAGLYFSDRGVRPLGRGGAFVAGADDLGALYYNPAGLAFAGSSVLIDGSWLHFTSDYQRQALVSQVDPNTGQPTGQQWVRTFDSVHGTSPVLPIPTIAVSHDFGVEKWNFAVGTWAPYSAITTYPDTVGNQPAPQRYSLLTLDGSALSVIGAWASYKPSDKVAIGFGPELLVGKFTSSIALSACIPERFACASEAPSWDAATQLSVGPIAAPSGNGGVIWSPSPDVRVGAAFQLPFWIDAPAKVDVRLPSASIFQNASVNGDAGHVKFKLPWTARMGVEWRGVPKTRMEAAFVYEAWSMHDRIDMTPDGIALQNVTGFPASYPVQPISIARNFRDAWSIRGGAEHELDLGRYKLDLRAGLMFETSAVPKEYLSVLTVDMPKVVATIGGSLHIGKWRFDAVYARVQAMSTTVDPASAKQAQLNPVRANPPANPDTVNGGTYSARADVLGIGLNYRFQ